MIRKSILWVAMFFAACTEVWAEAGTGAEKAVVYNSLRGRGRASFQAEVKGKGLVVNVPEEECRDLLWLIADGRSSWIRLQPGETVSVNVSAEHWKFSGDEKKTNSYLYDWTQKFWLEKPNYLTGTVEMMFSEIPREQKVWPEPSGLYRPEYRKWTESWERRAYDQLTTAKLRDEAFVAEQRERIHYNWLELQCLNFQMAQMQVEIPGETLEFVRNERFEHPGFMDYPGRDNVLRIYFDIADKLHLFDYTSIDFLRRPGELPILHCANCTCSTPCKVISTTDISIRVKPFLNPYGIWLCRKKERRFGKNVWSNTGPGRRILKNRKGKPLPISISETLTASRSIPRCSRENTC